MIAFLDCDLLVREMWDIGAITGVFDGYAADIPFIIQIKERVFVQIALPDVVLSYLIMGP